MTDTHTDRRTQPFIVKDESGHPIQKRKSCVYLGVRSFTQRFRKSAIPSMLKMLNDYEAEKLVEASRNKLKIVS